MRLQQLKAVLLGVDIAITSTRYSLGHFGDCFIVMIRNAKLAAKEFEFVWIRKGNIFAKASSQSRPFRIQNYKH